MTYEEWIEVFRKVYGDGESLCWYATEDMQRAFPELTRVYGSVTYALDEDSVYHDHHVWCVAPDGTVVDPTGGQYEGELLERRVLSTNPEYQRVYCVDCLANTFDFEPFESGLHMFESLRSAKIGDMFFVYVQGGRQAVPHTCHKEATHVLPAM